MITIVGCGIVFILLLWNRNIINSLQESERLRVEQESRTREVLRRLHIDVNLERDNETDSVLRWFYSYTVARIEKAYISIFGDNISDDES